MGIFRLWTRQDEAPVTRGGAHAAEAPRAASRRVEGRWGRIPPGLPSPSGALSERSASRETAQRMAFEFLVTRGYQPDRWGGEGHRAAWRVPGQICGLIV